MKRVVPFSLIWKNEIFVKKNICILKLDNGEETSDHNKILEAVIDFYQELYSEKNN